MKEITDNKLYAFVRLLKERKPFDSITTPKVNSWVHLLNILLDDKIDEWMTKLSTEREFKRFETVAESMSIDEFDEKLNMNIIKHNHIIGTRLLDDGMLEVVYTKKLDNEVKE